MIDKRGKQAEFEHWWHWAIQSQAGCHAIYEAGVRVNMYRPWAGVNDSDLKGCWRAQPFWKPDQQMDTYWADECAELREQIGECAGLFYAEHIAYEIDGHYADTKTLFAVSNDGERAIWMRV